MKKRNGKKQTEEIAQLFAEAQQIFSTDTNKAHILLKRAFEIAQQNRIRLTSEQRRQYCHKCYHYLYPNKNCEVRIDSDTKMLLHICKDCEHVNRFGYK